MITVLTFKQAHDFLLNEPDSVILDVREEPEYLSGHAFNAVNLPVDELNAAVAADVIPSLSTPVLVYCRTGRRSARAARMLEGMGYTKVCDMGGLVGWPYGLE